jgi:hypothetical protein
MKMTLNPPTGAGYFWWTNGGEHTPTIIKVDRSNDILYADNGEYSFCVGESPEVYPAPDYEGDEPVFTHEGKQYYFGTCLWSESPIELPEIDGEFVQPDSF